MAKLTPKMVALLALLAGTLAAAVVAAGVWVVDRGEQARIAHQQRTLLLERLSFLRVRSEERRVGKECRSRWSPYH